MSNFVFYKAETKPTRLWGDIPLFNVRDGVKLLDFCCEQNAAVLGIEGFNVVKGKRVPNMDYIADFSGLISVAGDDFPRISREAARRFIGSIIDEQLLLEFVLVKIGQ